ncbi:hypothetical protein DQ244_18865 [Blastococcus sp. TBT05-19]|uniref:hypothetical protein n=1 Tax=Blastococcus sp. TBT05-19 TaxID=2250581 RepID=UPI000DE817F5|nr:hypothetical protein [Blastococcus sp. TBT05-19]RBY86730.1 hypothetical protein DQ244_18865 [Blastococcus sp. TBT05-19]
MRTAAARTAPARLADQDGAVVPLHDIEDLHDADLDLVLADRLAESAGALRAVVAAATVAMMVSGPAALVAHALGAEAHRLAS